METFSTKCSNANAVPTTTLAKRAEPHSSKCQTFFKLLILLQQDESCIKYLWV